MDVCCVGLFYSLFYSLFVCLFVCLGLTGAIAIGSFILIAVCCVVFSC